MIALPAKLDTNASVVARSGARSAKVAPVIRIVSPNAMMMNSAQRSAMCAPEMSQSALVDAPMNGVRKNSHGPLYSIAIAAIHSAIRKSG